MPQSSPKNSIDEKRKKQKKRLSWAAKEKETKEI